MDTQDQFQDDKTADELTMTTKRFYLDEDELKEKQEALLNPEEIDSNTRPSKVKFHRASEYKRIGDIDLMEDECEFDENANIVTAFTIMTTVIALLSAGCMYLHYYFKEEVAQVCFVILLISLFLDLLVTRVLLCFLWSAQFWCRKKKVPSYMNNNNYLIDKKLLDSQKGFNYEERELGRKKGGEGFESIDGDDDSNLDRLGMSPDGQLSNRKLESPMRDLDGSRSDEKNLAELAGMSSSGLGLLHIPGMESTHNSMNPFLWDDQFHDEHIRGNTAQSVRPTEGAVDKKDAISAEAEGGIDN
jgi:hypothetical protein